MAEIKCWYAPRPSLQGTCLYLPSLLATPLGAKAKTVHLLSLLYYDILTLNQINVLTSPLWKFCYTNNTCR